MSRKSISILLVFSIVLSLITGFTEAVFADGGVTVDIVSFRRGAQADLRSSELLEARVEGYDGNVRELTYKWYNELGTYLYVYNSHNMYGINNTDGEIEIYNDEVSTSENMSGRSYKDSFSGIGYAWATVYGANLSNSALVGTVTVEVYDKNGNLIATDSHTGERKQTGGFLWWPTYTYTGFIEGNLEADLSNIAFGIFENDTKKVKDLLGESSMVHVTCVECDVPSCKITNGSQNISLASQSGDYYIKGLKKGTGEVSIKVEKSNCKFHQNVTVETVVTVYVYEKPETTADTTSITLGNLDDSCTYYIDGNEGIPQSDGTIVFENLTPNTTYAIEVVGYTAGTEPVYAYVYETTLPVHLATVEVYLNGGVDGSGNPYGELVNIDKVLGNGASIYLRQENTDNYYPLSRSKTGIYETTLSDGTYYIYYAKDNSAQICEQQFIINNAPRTRELFFYTVDYDANGGTYSGDKRQFHHDDDRVTVSSVIPTREGYDFLGWVDGEGNLYQAGDVLAESIYSPYTLTAKWEKSKYASVNLTVVLDHTGDGGENPNPGGEMEIDLAYRKDESEPYVEVVGKTITNNNWYQTGTTENSTTTVTYPNIFKDLSDDFEYSANIFLDHYYVTNSSVTARVDAEGNPIYDVTVYLKYNPDLFKLSYSVVADKSVPTELIPLAVDMKMLSWDANVKGQWAPISRHEEYSADINLEGRYGEGSYGVPVYRENNEKYYYRVAAVGFTLADGTELTASGTDGKTFYSDGATGLGSGAYYAVITVDGGADILDTDLDGAYGVYAENTGDGYVQQGTITVTIYINRYDVKFDSQGGSSVETIADQFTIPDVIQYIPAKNGYTFGGWYTDANCTVGNEVKTGTVLTSDITLYAKWIENKTVKGTITVAGFYTIDNEMYTIPAVGRVQTVKVLLQKIDHNGYEITMANTDVSVIYNGNYGTGTYEFKDIPNDGTQYRINVVSADYVAVYQNELSSSTVVNDYASYNQSSYGAEFGNNNEAVVNTYMHFEPVNFDLEYSIDATAIGEGYRPTSVEMLILSDDGKSGLYPQSWPVISQMVKSDGYEGQRTSITNGTGRDSYSVWMIKPDGISLFDYSIKIKDYFMGGVEMEYDSSAPFGIRYSGFARYDEADGQTQPLTATFIPKMYNITYDLGVPVEVEVKNMESYLSMSGTYVDSYYWSYGKTIEAMPQREGYTFLGWYDAEGNAVSSIAGDEYGDITLYARWQNGISFEVLSDAGYYSAARDSSGKVGVIALNARIIGYDDIKDSIVSFGLYVLNSPTSEEKITVDSTSTVTLDNDKGEFHTIISNIPEEKFGVMIYGMPYVAIDTDGDKSTADDIEVISGSLFDASVSKINKWLGDNNVYAN